MSHYSEQCMGFRMSVYGKTKKIINKKIVGAVLLAKDDLWNIWQLILNINVCTCTSSEGRLRFCNDTFQCLISFIISDFKKKNSCCNLTSKKRKSWPNERNVILNKFWLPRMFEGCCCSSNNKSWTNVLKKCKLQKKTWLI